MVRTRILVVEDESVLALFLRTSLESLGYQVVATVDNGSTALQEVESQHPDLVLMDVRIKGDIDGIVTAEKIYSRFDVPVVYLTAFSDDKTLQRATQTAPFGYLLKPFNEKELRPAIEVALHRHAVERKLRQSERWFSTTLKSLGDAVAVTDMRGQIIYLNPAAEKLTKYSMSEALGLDHTQVFKLYENSGRSPSEDLARQAIQIGILEAPGKKVLVDRKGGKKLVDDSSAPIRDEAGSIIGAVLIFRETTTVSHASPKTRRKSSELPPFPNLSDTPAQLATQAAQMASLGVMASGISHEISRPLHAILVNASSVLFWHKRNQGVLPDTFIKKINDISDYAEKIDQIIRNMHGFWISRSQVGNEHVDLNETVRNAIILSDRISRLHGLKPQLELAEEVLLIHGNAMRLEQVIINLITNAFLASEKILEADKWIRIATSNRKNQAQLVIECNAPPLDETLSQDLSDPAITVPSTDDGYRLNLAISKLFVEELHGQLEITGGAETGMTCTILFPLQDPNREKIDENIISG